MSAGWVAGSVRARSLTTRRLGRVRARDLAATGSLEDALAVLARTPYGHAVRPGQTLDEAQRAVHDTLLWNARVLGGWVPREGTTVLRVLLAPFEIANVDAHLRRLRGDEGAPPYRLGTMGTAWPRLAATRDLSQVRQVLTASAWGDPGAETPDEIVWSMRMSLADRVVAVAPGAVAWAGGAVALMLARTLVLEQRRLPPRGLAWATRVVGGAAGSATSLPDLAAALPRSAAWALADVQGPHDLWQAEGRWWTRVERDGFALARTAREGPDVLLGSLALLACDAWRVRAALEVAARVGTTLEVFDEVA